MTIDQKTLASTLMALQHASRALHYTLSREQVDAVTVEVDSALTALHSMKSKTTRDYVPVTDVEAFMKKWEELGAEKRRADTFAYAIQKELLTDLEEKLSGAEWARIHSDEIDIVDPDGWDRKDLDASMAEKITHEEFMSRAYRSTLAYKVPPRPEDEPELADETVTIDVKEFVKNWHRDLARLVEQDTALLDDLSFTGGRARGNISSEGSSKEAKLPAYATDRRGQEDRMNRMNGMDDGLDVNHVELVGSMLTGRAKFYFAKGQPRFECAVRVRNHNANPETHHNIMVQFRGQGAHDAFMLAAENRRILLAGRLKTRRQGRMIVVVSDFSFTDMNVKMNADWLMKKMYMMREAEHAARIVEPEHESHAEDTVTTTEAGGSRCGERMQGLPGHRLS